MSIGDWREYDAAQLRAQGVTLVNTFDVVTVEFQAVRLNVAEEFQYILFGLAHNAQRNRNFLRLKLQDHTYPKEALMSLLKRIHFDIAQMRLFLSLIK